MNLQSISTIIEKRFQSVYRISGLALSCSTQSLGLSLIPAHVHKRSSSKKSKAFFGSAFTAIGLSAILIVDKLLCRSDHRTSGQTHVKARGASAEAKRGSGSPSRTLHCSYIHAICRNTSQAFIEARSENGCRTERTPRCILQHPPCS